jgi:hypothetical protein
MTVRALEGRGREGARRGSAAHRMGGGTAGAWRSPAASSACWEVGKKGRECGRGGEFGGGGVKIRPTGGFHCWVGMEYEI